MAVRKPGFRDTDTNRNKRDNRYSNSGANNQDTYRLTQDGPPANNETRNRFVNEPVTP